MAVVTLDAPRLSRERSSLLVATYTAAVFVGAGLVFLVEPMIAKMVLPVFGGASAVWITALVFFQVVLLGGYGYAHLSHRLLGRRQPLLHAVVLGLGLVALPIALPANAAPAPHTPPALWLLVVLTVAVGAPFFVVTAASPTLQRWFSHSTHPRAHDPYFLYAASNVGSLLALVAYPLLVEPNLTLYQQTTLWLAGYVLFCGLCAACCIVSARSGSASADDTRRAASTALTWRTRAWWIGLAFVPASLLVGATSYLSTDIAPIPLLWVVPLATYLVTFVIAFSRRPLATAKSAGRLLPFVVVAFALSVPGLFTTPVWVAIIVQPAIVLVAGLLAHGTLSAQRPAAEHLTEFFVLLALGGVLGSVFAALVAPLLFSSLIEYPLVIGLALLLRCAWDPARGSSRARGLRDAALGCVVLMVPLIAASAAGVPIRLGLAVCAVASLVFYRRPVAFACGITLLCVLLVGKTGLLVERTFYGVLIVRDAPGHLHILNNGTTIHGLEWYDGRRGDQPLGYYTRAGPIGQVFSALSAPGRLRDVGVVGLGVGALAAYGRRGQQFTFFEIDPADVAIAENPRYFTFLHDSAASIRIVTSDGRLGLGRVAPASYDLLVMDAFSSDAIPVHMLTRQALALEVSRVRPGGVLAFHISNRYLELEPVLAAAARDLHLTGLAQFDSSPTPAERAYGKSASHWVVLARSTHALAVLVNDPRWHALAISRDRAWTDDYSDVTSAIAWSA